MCRRYVGWVALVLAVVLCACGGGDSRRDGLQDDVGDAGTLDVVDAPEDVADVRDVEREPEDEPEPLLFADGRACTSDDECEGGICLTDEGWQDGYCTRVGCEACPDRCFQYDGESYCGRRCGDIMLCRDGYSCMRPPSGTERVCIGQFGLPDGAACVADDECFSGECRLDWPGGYCTRTDCTANDECAPFGGGSRCISGVAERSFCAAGCDSTADCRQGYHCDEEAGGVCTLPRPQDPIARQHSFLDIQCAAPQGSQMSLAFEVPQGSTSYLLVPFSSDGAAIDPRKIDLPDGSIIDYAGDHYFQMLSLMNDRGISPLMVPATDQHTAHVQLGQHSVEIDTTASSTCYYLLPSEALGEAIDLNFYFVGLGGGLDAGSAPTDVDFQGVIDRVNRIFMRAGLIVDDVRYNDLTHTQVQQFQIIRSFEDIEQLVSLAEIPADYDSALSVDIFLVRSILGSPLGLSNGIPGPAGLHGVRTAGIVLEAEHYVEEPARLSRTIAHEIGHYLGLFHTSEQSGGLHDPLSDTPECTNIYDCEAEVNLMYPYSRQGAEQITPQQSYVLKVNPLARAHDAPSCGDCGPNENCVQRQGAYHCVCESGFEPQNGACVDIDECARDTAGCDPAAICTNLPGSYECACPSGYTGDGLECTDIDECQSGTAQCGNNATCTNEPGSFTCSCDSGYQGDGITCTDIDECATGQANCGANASCNNNPGSFECHCDVGWSGDGITCTAHQPTTPRLAARAFHTCGVSDQSEVVCWGSSQGDILSTPTGLFTQVDVGSSFACALRLDGTIACWGSRTAGTTNVPTGAFEQLAVGTSHACARRASGVVECWGMDYYGETTPPAGTFIDISAGVWASCGVHSDGTIACWGKEAPPVNDVPYNEVVVGAHFACGLRTDQSLACSTSSIHSYPQTPTAEKFVSLTPQYTFLCGVQTNGQLKCWGGSRMPPTPSGTFTQAATGSEYGCGFTTAGDVQCWGTTSYGAETPPAGFP